MSERFSCLCRGPFGKAGGVGPWQAHARRATGVRRPHIQQPSIFARNRGKPEEGWPHLAAFTQTWGSTSQKNHPSSSDTRLSPERGTVRARMMATRQQRRWEEEAMSVPQAGGVQERAKTAQVPQLAQPGGKGRQGRLACPREAGYFSTQCWSTAAEPTAGTQPGPAPSSQTRSAAHAMRQFCRQLCLSYMRLVFSKLASQN